jgi:hypothetical protein
MPGSIQRGLKFISQDFGTTSHERRLRGGNQDSHQSSL